MKPETLYKNHIPIGSGERIAETLKKDKEELLARLQRELEELNEKGDFLGANRKAAEIRQIQAESIPIE